MDRNTAIKFVIIAILLILAQAVVFNNLVLFNTAMPFVFIYIIIALPVTLNTNWALTIGFVTGLAIDAFSDTYGMNALACTLLAFVRKPVFHLYVPRDEDLASQPITARALGAGPYMKYLLTMVVIYCIMILVIEAFSFGNLLQMIVRIVASAAYTFVLIFALDSLVLTRQHAK